MNFDTENEAPVSVARTVLSRTRALDAFLLSFVPVVLVGVYQLPVRVRRSLVFEYTDPSVVTAFGSTFVHLGQTHLLVNLGAYAVVVPVVFALNVLSGTRRRFYTVFATFLLVFPVVLSYLNLAVLRPAVSVGFSGVVMAFVGYLPLTLADYVHVQFDIGPRESVAPTLFFVSLALIAALSVQSVVPGNATVLLGTSGLVLAALLSALLYAVPVYERPGRLRSKLGEAIHEAGYFELVVVGGLLVLAFPFVAFPSDPGAGDGVLNLYVHLLGYALGFMVTYVVVQTGVTTDAEPV